MRLALVLAAIAAPLGGEAPVLPDPGGARAAVERAGLTGRITVAQRFAWTDDLRRAREVARRLDGARAAELRTVLDGVQGAGPLTPARMPQAFLTLRRNTAFWRARPYPAPGARTTFGDDPAVFQYVPGQGMQFHPLATAGRANWMADRCLVARRVDERRLVARAAERERAARRRAKRAAGARRAGAGARGLPVLGASVAAAVAPSPAPPKMPAPPGAVTDDGAEAGAGPAAAGPAAPPRVGVGREPRARRGGGCRPAELEALLDTLVDTAARRGGFAAWEYRYSFAGGPPLWISAMTQATAASALARGAEALGEPAYRAVALDALGAFTAAPPLGVAPPGGEYVMYSFNPGLRILNGFLQSVIGLHDVADLTGSRTAAALYADGERAARRAVPAYDTGAWSRYSLAGRESTLGYHRLVTGFLAGLCERTSVAIYCNRARRFARYTHEPPRIGLHVPRRGLKPNRPTALTFSLSKISDTTVTVRRNSAGTVTPAVLWRRGSFVRGAGYRYAWTPPRPGTYRVRVAAVGPEGRRGVATREVTVARARKPRRESRG